MSLRPLTSRRPGSRALRAALVAGAMVVSPGTLVAQVGQDPPLSPDLCGTVTPPGTGVVYGLIRDAATTVALPGGTANLVWARARGVADTLRGGDVAVSDERGRYWFCDVPAGTRVTVWASALGRMGSAAELALAEGERARRDLQVGLARASLGAVAGRLLDAETDRPVDAATLTVRRHGVSALTDSDGRFRIRDVPAGVQELEVRHVAYGSQRATVEVLPDRTAYVEIRVAPTPIALEPLVVAVELRPHWLEKVGFYDRKARGLGQFLGPQELEKRHLQRFSQLLENVPGLKLYRVCTPYCFYYVRATTSSGPCLPQFYVDGQKVWLPAITDLDAVASVHDVAAVEVYRGISQTPAQYYGKCGSVVIWTKRAAG